jgi:hypothetical protein
MHATARRWRLLVMAVLFLLSMGVLLAVRSPGAMHSTLHTILRGFVGPGVTVWWLSLGGLFQAVPTSLPHVAYAAAVNTACWTSLTWLIGAATRWVRCGTSARRR